MKQGERIAKNENLYRRGYNSPQKKYLNPDGSATSRVFKLRAKDDGKLSVNLSRLITKEEAVSDKNRFNLFQIENQVVEEIDLYTIYDAEFNSHKNSHCLIIGLEMDDDAKPAYLAKKSQKVYP